MDDTECLICLEDLDSKDRVVLSCKHVMHYKCLQKWIDKKKNYTKLCPICDTPGEIMNIIEAVPLQKVNYCIRNEDEIIKPSLFCCNIL